MSHRDETAARPLSTTLSPLHTAALAFTTQRLSVAVLYSAAQEVAEALGLSVAADPRAAP